MRQFLTPFMHLPPRRTEVDEQTHTQYTGAFNIQQPSSFPVHLPRPFCLVPLLTAQEEENQQHLLQHTPSLHTSTLPCLIIHLARTLWLYSWCLSKSCMRERQRERENCAGVTNLSQHCIGREAGRDGGRGGSSRDGEGGPVRTSPTNTHQPPPVMHIAAAMQVSVLILQPMRLLPRI